MSRLPLPLMLDRLRIDQLQADDAPVLSAYRSDPDVARWQDWDAPYPQTEARRIIAAMAHDEIGRPGNRTNLAVRAGGGLVGDVYLHVLADTPHVAEIGATLSTETQGRGYATEALGGLIEALFAGGDVIKVMAYVDVDNGPSLALCDRLGLRREGHLSHSFRRSDGSYADEILFGLVRPDLP